MEEYLKAILNIGADVSIQKLIDTLIENKCILQERLMSIDVNENVMLIHNIFNFFGKFKIVGYEEFFTKHNKKYNEDEIKKLWIFKNSCAGYKLQIKLIDVFGYNVPNIDVLNAITECAQNKTILEIGAGLGLFGSLLQKKGVKVILTDKQSISNGFTQIQCCDNIESLQRFSSCEVLMLIWPPYDNSMAHQSLELFKGDLVIYIGENEDGCTGDRNFHKLLQTEWILMSFLPVAWYLMASIKSHNNKCWIYKRK